MAKDLIIGVCSNYKYDDVKPWVKSSKDCGFEGDVVLVTIDMDEETNNQIEKTVEKGNLLDVIVQLRKINNVNIDLQKDSVVFVEKLIRAN
jgi:hypothetical protein